MLSSDGLFQLFADCIIDAHTEEMVAVWDVDTKAPHANYPRTLELMQRYSDEIPPPVFEVETISPNWSGFRTGMLSNWGYQRITLLAAATPAGNLAVQRTENAMTMSEPNLAVIVMLWEQILAQIPLANKPTSAEIGQWNGLVIANHMPFTFTADGKMRVS
jgi:hypothetical protein